MLLLRSLPNSGAHLKELSKIEKQDALILDDFGVQPFDAGSRALLIEVLNNFPDFLTGTPKAN